MVNFLKFLTFYFLNCFGLNFAFSHLVLVSGSRWLCTQNLYGNFQPWLTRHPNVNKWISSPDLCNFRQFHRHILKNRTMLFTATFISASEKIEVGLKKNKRLILFCLMSRREGLSDIPVLTFFFPHVKWRYFQLHVSGLWNTVDSRYLDFQGTLWYSSRYP